MGNNPNSSQQLIATERTSLRPQTRTSAGDVIRGGAGDMVPEVIAA
jgi:hypothetical protein